MRRLGWGAVWTVLALAAISCGKGGLTPVRGSVTLDGKPVENAQVIFMPPQGGAGKYATGRTGADGSFQLTTSNPNDGAFPGEYLVVVQYEEGTEVPPAANVKDAFAGRRKAELLKKKPPRYVIPAIYSDPTKSVLRQKVPAEGVVKLELKSK